MKISDLIATLNSILHDEGDLEVVTDRGTPPFQLNLSAKGEPFIQI